MFLEVKIERNSKMKLYNQLKSEIIKNWQEMKKDRSLMLKNLSKALFLFSAIAFIFNFGYFIFFLFSGLAINERAKKFIIEKYNNKNFSNKKYIGIMLSIAFLGFIFSGDSDEVKIDGVADDGLNAISKIDKLPTKAPSTVITLVMKCEDKRRGGFVFVKHFDDGLATIIRNVENPIDTYNPVAKNVKIQSTRDSQYWYDVEDINREFNIDLNRDGFEFTNAKLDLRKTILGSSVIPSFGFSTKYYNSYDKEFQTRSSGSYQCYNISSQEFPSNM